MLSSGEIQKIIPDIPSHIQENIQKIKFRKSWYLDDKQEIAFALGYDNFLEAYVDLHLNKKLSTGQIGGIFGVCQSAVAYRLHSINCPMNPRGGNNNHGTRFLYDKKGPRCPTKLCTVWEKKIGGRWGARKTKLIAVDGWLCCPKCGNKWRIKNENRN